MEGLWEKISSGFEEAELLSFADQSVSLDIKNGEAREMSAEKICAWSLRVIKNGRIGFNFTMGSSPRSLDNLAAGAGLSADFGSKALFSFSGDRSSGKPPRSGGDIVDYAGSLLSLIKSKDSKVPVNIHVSEHSRTISVRTSRGGDCKEILNTYVLHLSAPVPGGSSEVSCSVYSNGFFPGMPEEADSFLSDYRASRGVSNPPTGKLPVLFSPEALFLFVYSLQEGVSARNLYLGVSPLAGKLGEGLFSEKISLADEPGAEGSPHSRSFDDEGVGTSDRAVVSGGVLENFICDLHYGAGLGRASTGNGVKSSLFSEGIGAPVSPAFINPVIKPGRAEKKDMIKGLGEGIVVEDIIGFHSSNYTQGHFSVQAHGFHVSGGEVKGRLEDVMIAGNIYEDFKNVSAVGGRLYRTSFGYAPYMLVENISVSGG